MMYLQKENSKVKEMCQMEQDDTEVLHEKRGYGRKKLVSLYEMFAVKIE